MSGREFLHTPGPTHIPDEVLNAMHRQALDPFDGRLHHLAKSCFDDMKEIFRTSGSVFIYAGTGHGGWEAALTNICVPGDTVLVVEIGHFSNNWADHARALGLKTEIILGDWRRAVEPAEVERRLRADTERKIKAVLAVQVDTATGIVTDIREIRAAIDAAGHPALLVVDTIASLAAMPFEMDAWGVDVTIAASQKALMCPPGLTMVAANTRALDVATKTPRNQRYWDWGNRLGTEYYTKFCGTMPEHHIFALRAALDIIRKRGLEAIFYDHRRFAGAVHAAVDVWSQGGVLAFNATVREQRSVTVTTIRTDPHLNPEIIRSYARERLGLALAGGMSALAGKAFRIGHMGSLNEPMLLGCIATTDLALKELAVPHGQGAVQAAIDYLARERAKSSQASPVAA